MTIKISTDPIIRLTLPLTPLLNRYYRKFNNRMVLSADGQTYKDQVALICQTAGIQPLEGDVSITADVYRKARRGDIDGYIKGLLDALQGYAYLSDSQIVELRMMRYDDKHNPRVEVTITTI